MSLWLFIYAGDGWIASSFMTEPWISPWILPWNGKLMKHGKPLMQTRGCFTMNALLI